MVKNKTGLPNREFLMLAQTYDPKRHGVGGWYVSVKLDGMRAVWDGGITRGLSVYEVPFANTIRETGNRGEGTGNERICTGLWSRYGKVIHAPDWWLDSLPPFPLDGELWVGNNEFQTLIGTVKKLIPVDLEWEKVRYCVFDAPSYQQIFGYGRINNVNYVRSIDDSVWNWVENQVLVKHTGLNDLLKFGLGRTFNTTYSFLRRELGSNCLSQEILPIHTDKAVQRMQELLDQVTDEGGEGLILRDPNSLWIPKRNEWMVKVKKLHDMEGVVLGYRAGIGKLEGLMGSVRLRIKSTGGIDREFELSGFTDEERILDNPAGVKLIPGEVIDDSVMSLRFPRGSMITFRYREMTNDGLPREARYLRKRL